MVLHKNAGECDNDPEKEDCPFIPLFLPITSDTRQSLPGAGERHFTKLFLVHDRQKLIYRHEIFKH